MSRPCLFCPNAATTKEHLWSDWILKSIPPRKHPIRATIGKAAPREFYGDIRVRCVCGPCNHGWMSALESMVKPFVGAMIHDLSISITPEQQKTIAVWALKTAMVLEATISQAGHRLYTRSDCEQLRTHSVIPDRSLLWLGRISESGVFASGTHIWLVDNVTRSCDGQVSTFTVGHLAMQVLTIHAPQNAGPVQTICRAGPWDESLLGIYPANQMVKWPPPLSFSVRSGSVLFAQLRDRWKIGRRR